MSRDFLITADASKVNGADFLRAMTGRPPLTAADREAKRRADEAYWAKRREENRREIEGIRNRLCKLASPELAAKFRAKWAEEDREQEERERRRAA